MRITVRTGGLLGQYLPADGAKNLAALDVDDGSTAADVMRQLGFPEDRTYLVVLNGENLPKSARTDQRLEDGDELAVLPPLKGG